MFYCFLNGIILVTVPLNWHSGSCDVKGITGCMLLGAAASPYNMHGLVFFMQLRKTITQHGCVFDSVTVVFILLWKLSFLHMC